MAANTTNSTVISSLMATSTNSSASSSTTFTPTAYFNESLAVADLDINNTSILLDIPLPFNGNPAMLRLSKAITAISVLILVEVMLGLGCSVDFEILRKHIKKPVGIVVAGITQFGLMPLIAFGLGRAVHLAPVPGLATLVTASVPGGVLSNVLAYLIKGDMSLSMLMTTTSTILALAFIPLNLFIYGTNWLPAGSDLATLVPYSSIALSFALMIGPTLLGIFIKWKTPKAAEYIKTVCKVLLILTIIAMIVLSTLLYGTELLLHIPDELWLVAVSLPAIGYTIGFILSSIGGMRGAARRTVSIETGCQNSHMSAAVLKVAFPSNVIGGYYLFPLIYGAIQFLEGSIVVIVTLVYMRFSGDKPDLQADSTKAENAEESQDSSSFGKWSSNLQLKWLSRKRGEDKDHILPAKDEGTSNSSNVVANVAHEIVETASTNTHE